MLMSLYVMLNPVKYMLKTARLLYQIDQIKVVKTLNFYLWHAH